MDIYMFNILCAVILFIIAVIRMFVPLLWLNSIIYILVGAAISSLICIHLED